MGEMDKPVGFVGNGDLAFKPKFAPEVGSVVAENGVDDLRRGGRG